MRRQITWAVAAAALLSFAPGPALAGATLFFYPKTGQSSEQQNKDTYECHSWAVGQTGYDPSNPSVTTATSSTSASTTAQADGTAVRGAARGAALGAIGGAIAGDAGKGAAAGAAIGGAGSVMRKRSRGADQAKQERSAQAQEQAALEAKKADYRRAMSGCMEARDYVVK